MTKSSRVRALEQARYLILGTVAAIVLLVLGIGIWSVLGGGGSGEITAGLDYRELDEPLTPRDGPIVVSEFFSYACPHCYDFEADIAAWSERLPDDVRLERQPLGFNASWRILADAYHALDQTGMLNSMHLAIFRGLHDRGDRRLFTAEGLTELVEGRVGRGDAFARAMRSNGVRSASANAQRLANAADIRSVPTLMVDGRWVIESGTPASLRIADRLIERARRERRQQAAAPATD